MHLRRAQVNSVLPGLWGWQAMVPSGFCDGGGGMLPRTSQECFSGERFSDGVAVRFADVTTCYPGQPFQGTTAHDGDVRNRHKVGKRARPTYQPAFRAKNLNGPRAVFRKVLWG